MEDREGMGGSCCPSEEGTSLGSELALLQHGLQLTVAPVCSSCPGPALPSMGFFAGLWAEVREKLTTAVCRYGGAEFWCGQMTL